MPFLCVFWGLTSADKVQNGQSYLAVVSEVDLKKINLETLRKLPRYLGRSGDYIFTWNPIEKNVTVSKQKEDEKLVLHHFPSTVLLPVSYLAKPLDRDLGFRLYGRP